MVVVVGFLLCSAFGNAMVLGHNPFIVLIVPLAPGPLPPPFPPGTFPVQMISYQLIPCLQPNGLIFLEKTHKLSQVLSPVCYHPESPPITQDSSTVSQLPGYLLRPVVGTLHAPP